MSDLLYEPLKYYESEGRHKHEKNVDDFFSELHLRSGVNAEENRKTVAEYRQKKEKADKLQSKLTGKKTVRVLLFILAAISLIVAIAGIANASALPIIFGILLTAASLLFIFLKLNKTIKHFSELLLKKQAEADELLSLAYEQMEPLNSLFGEKDTVRLVEKTIPELNFDEFFSYQRETEMRELYGYNPEYDENRSTLDTLSGEYKGNPFLFERELIHYTGSETYHGHLTISWTETYRDSKGNFRTRVRTQTLTASVTKPKPMYRTDTTLKFFAQGAPDLTFTREGLYHDDKSEKQIEKLVKKGEKQLKKKAQKALEEGKDFTEMANTEFDVLFDALNRDHEVQFRMMFTPLAQNNMIDLMRSKVGYGDDFDFYKQKRMTVIHSDHAQTWQMDTEPKNYRSYDFEEAKSRFKTFNEEFFKSVFFDFAPLLAVPMYHEKPVKSLEPPKEYKINYTKNEYETLANRMDQSLFLAENSATRAILKANGVERSGEEDSVEVCAHSFFGFDRIDYISVMGGDGRMHPVPVPWVEYIPNERTSYIKVSRETGENEERTGESSLYYHSLFAKYDN
ncbi:MAG: hypothetical protein IIW20_03700 [Clostridia bacterium]|nr:hypothetical protein [Clostridia bacterium]